MQRNQQPAASAARSRTTTSDTDDQLYGLVSVLYHALQGVQACEQYLDDAERAGDDELVRFFEEARAQQNERANRAKQLLVVRAEEEDDEDEDEDEAGTTE